jgi:hemerythrin-like metal-binding protein
MRHFEWSNEENEIYIAQIDAEHRDLFQIARGLEQALEKHLPQTEIQEHLRALASHVEDHLSHEEWLMQSVSYPSYGWHRSQHETARRRLKLFVPLVEQGDAEAADVFLEFLAGWLHDHTSVTDRMMGAYVRNYERAHSTNALERWGSAVARAAAARASAARVGNSTPESSPFPKTIRFCTVCGAQTTHELRPGGLACQKCAERSVSAELDRD